jgi:Domain of unknown function (DUF397)
VTEPEHARLVWRKSRASETGGCVEVAMGSESVYVRNSRHTDGGPLLEFRSNEWAAFLTGVRNGEFELPSAPPTRSGD